MENGSYASVDDNATFFGVFGETKIGNRVHVSLNLILSKGGRLYVDDFFGLASHV